MPTYTIYRAIETSTTTPIQLGTFNAREFTIVVGAATELYVNQASAPAASAVSDGQSVVIVQPYSALTLTNTDPSTCWIRSHGTASFYSVHWIT